MICVILWGSFSAILKLVLNNMDAFQLQWFIYICASLMMLVLMFLTGGFQKIARFSRKQYILLLVISIFSFLYYLFYSLALRSIPAIEASMINYLFPLLIVLVAVVLHRERLHKMQIIGLIISFIGAATLILNGNISELDFSSLSGVGLALAASFMWAFYSNVLRWVLVDWVIAIFVVVAIGLLGSTIAVFQFSSFEWPEPSSWIGLIWLSLTNFVICNLIWFRVVQQLPVAHVSSITFLTPLINVIFIYWLIGETLTWSHVAGFIGIMAGIFLSFLNNGR